MRFLLAALVAVLSIAVVPIPTPANAQDSASPLGLRVTKITPEVVGEPGELTVAGTLTNTSDGDIRMVEARVERGSPVSGSSDVQQAFEGNSLRVTQPNFRLLSDSLAPGQQIHFELRVPVAGSTDSLQISEPGTYPLVLNVNGQPEGSSRARLAEANFLLPVLSTPQAGAQRPPQPLPTSIVLPIVDYPRVETTEDDKPVLLDEQLARSIAPGGRLSDLVRTMAERLRPGSPLSPSVCFAIDPDLLATVDAMSRGYLIQQPGDGTREGPGADAAKVWLNELRDLVKGRCVIALPYADADVVALGRAGLPDLIKGALDGSGIVAHVLKMEPRRDLFWPIGGALDEPAATHLNDLGINTFLMHPNALGDQVNPLQPAELETKGTPTALPIDPLLVKALDPTGGRPTLVPKDDGLPSVQNALGALTYRANTAAPKSRTVIAPPRRWNLRGNELNALFTGLEALQRAQLIEPTALTSDGPAPKTNLAYPVQMATKEIPRTVLDDLARENFKVGDLFRSSHRDPAVDVQPAAVTTPLRDALLTGASSAWRGDPGAARDWVRRATDRIARVLSMVQVDIPPNVVTLSAGGPIPVKVSNRLPITVDVVLRTKRSSGIEIKPLGLLSVPPQGGRSFWPETEVQRAGRFTVDLIATTEEGTELGSSKRLQVKSSSYDAFVVGLTGVAAALLVVLSGLRIVRRIRASRTSGHATTTTDGDDGPS